MHPPVGAGEGPAAPSHMEVVTVGRIKWFTPSGEQAFKPFGIDCEGSATLYGNRGGWHLAGVTGPDLPRSEDIARENRAFWARLEGAAASTRPAWRRRLRGRRP